MTLPQQLARYIAEKNLQGLYRTRQLPTASFLDFSCNDYLSLSSDPRLKKAYQTGFQQYAAGSGGSMVLCGYHASHQALEQDFASALGVDDCLLFSSGYVANLAVVSLLAQFGTHFVVDKAVHASIYDGLKFSGASFSRFAHNDVQDLSCKLQKSSRHTVVFTESIFSMSGQCAPLAAIAELIAALDCGLVVDEAHGFGILGQHGLGGAVAAGLSQAQVPLRIIPFGKALGGSGAIVAGQALWIDALLQATRQPIYSTAISPAYAYGLRAALAILLDANERRQHLQRLIAYFQSKIKDSPLSWRPSHAPIQQLQLGCPHQALHYTQKLRDHAIQCFAIRQPTVAKKDTGLRVILNYQHTIQDIDRLFAVLHA